MAVFVIFVCSGPRKARREGGERGQTKGPDGVFKKKEGAAHTCFRGVRERRADDVEARCPKRPALRGPLKLRAGQPRDPGRA